MMEHYRVLLRLFIFCTIIHQSSSTSYSCNSQAACGCSSSSVTVNRIVGGENATKAAWGWAASISIAGTYFCGGSVLSKSWIITAAHCVHGYTASQITVYVGSILRWSGTQSQVAAEINVHSGYDSVTYANDIALIRLTSPLALPDPDIVPICIPSVNAQTLSNTEWPKDSTTVRIISPSSHLFFLLIFIVHIGLLGRVGWMGFIIGGWNVFFISTTSYTTNSEPSSFVL